MCIHLVTILFFNFETTRDGHPDMPLTSRHTARSSRISASLRYTWQPLGRRSGVQRFISDAQFALHGCSIAVGRDTLGCSRRQKSVV